MKKILITLSLILSSFAGCIAAGFSERELVVTASDGVRMGATLTLPDAEATPKAALVLATGSGTQNRDEELIGKRPFRRLAEFLSEHGYAVLRVDDRGFENPKDAEGAVEDTYSGDVASAVAVVDSLYPGLKTGIIGHSAGGGYAIRNAAYNPRVDFIITLAAPAWSGDSVVMSQSRAMAVAMTGRWDAEPLQRKVMDIAKSPASDLSARTMLLMAFEESLGEMANLPQVRQQLTAQIDGVLSPWYRSMLRYDPAEDIKKIKVPFLALNGSKDTQVLPGNLVTIRELNPSVTAMEMEGHNHLFLPCATGLVQEYASLPGDISEQTLSVILEWLDGVVK